MIERTLELLEDLGVARIGVTIGFSGAAVRRHIAESTVVSAARTGFLCRPRRITTRCQAASAFIRVTRRT